MPWICINDYHTSKYLSFFMHTTPAQVNVFTGVACVEEGASVMGMKRCVVRISDVLSTSLNTQCQLLQPGHTALELIIRTFQF